MAVRGEAGDIGGTLKDQTVLVAAQTPDAESSGEMKIASIMFAPLRCFVTSAGGSFYEGAKLPDGNVVESIGENGVVLRRGTERKELALFTGNEPVGGVKDGT